MGGRVFRVFDADGRSSIVKQPSAAALRDGEPARAADYLAWRRGQGAVEIHARQGDLILLEELSGPTLRDRWETEGDDTATSIAADVIKRLHEGAAEPPPSSLLPLRRYFRSLFARAEIDRRKTARSQFMEAAEIAERLLSQQEDVMPLHGDIHHDNILGSERGWLAIDPKGLIGDPAFDAANLFCNPGEGAWLTDQHRIASMATILAKTLRQDAFKLLDFAFAYAALSAAWHIEDDDSGAAKRVLAIGCAISAVRISLVR